MLYLLQNKNGQDRKDCINLKIDKEEEQPINKKKEILEWIGILAIAAVIAFVLNTFIVANSTIGSGSMESTIMTGDRVFGSRLAYLFAEPERGDIVIFDHPTGPSKEETRLVKRIIGLPGETVTIRDGQVYIDEEEMPLEENYLNEAMQTADFSVQVAEGCYFMMGDNRNHSVDARSWGDPDVPEDKIIAKVLIRYYPRIGRIR